MKLTSHFNSGFRHSSCGQYSFTDYEKNEGSLLRCNCSGTEHDWEVYDVGPDLSEALSALRQRIGDKSQKGRVYLVGTGPGDPGYLTLRAVELMQSADVILYDRLVSNEILEYVHDAAVMIYVGKQKGYHTRSQDEIHELLLQFAGHGATVLRLKGGDPIVFGRGGEEMDFLRQRGVQVQTVSGITAASGIGSELGIPLTHRGLSNSVTFLTGHSRDGGFDTTAELAAHAKQNSTLVVYMGLGALPTLTATLREQGLEPLTPAVAIMKGTTANQRAVFAPLGELAEAVEEAGLKSPTLMMIGEVVSLSPLYPGAGARADVDSHTINAFFGYGFTPSSLEDPSTDLEQGTEHLSK